MLSANASSLGLGAILVQEQANKEKKPVAFESRSMTSTEQRYAQIEKEALAITSACDKFKDYILGKDILTETDQKPLVPLFGSKTLDELPPRIQRFPVRLMKYSFKILHAAGKDSVTADALSRAPLSKQLSKEDETCTFHTSWRTFQQQRGNWMSEDFTNRMMKYAGICLNSVPKAGQTIKTEHLIETILVRGGYYYCPKRFF